MKELMVSCNWEIQSPGWCHTKWLNTVSPRIHFLSSFSLLFNNVSFILMFNIIFFCCSNTSLHSVLKQHTFLILWFWRSKFCKWILYCCNEGIQRVVILLEVLGENHFLVFPVSETTCSPGRPLYCKRISLCCESP